MFTFKESPAYVLKCSGGVKADKYEYLLIHFGKWSYIETYTVLKSSVCVCVYMCTHTHTCIHIHAYVNLDRDFSLSETCYGISNKDAIIIFKVLNFQLLTFCHRCNCQAQCLLVKEKSVVSILFRLLVWKFKVSIQCSVMVHRVQIRVLVFLIHLIHIWTQGY